MKNQAKNFQKIRHNTFLEHPAKVFSPKKGKGSSYNRKLDPWDEWYDAQDVLQEIQATGNLYG